MHDYLYDYVIVRCRRAEPAMATHHSTRRSQNPSVIRQSAARYSRALATGCQLDCQHSRMQQSGIAGIARMPSTRNAARQICSLEPACELNIAPRPGNLRKVRWGACVARAARADDQSGGGLPQELQQARRVKTLGLAASVTVLTAGTAAALAAGMRPPQDVLWTLGCGAAFVPLGLATAKAALGELCDRYACREHSLHVAVSRRKWRGR